MTPAAGATLVVDIFPGIHSGRPSPEYDTSSATPFLDTLNPVELDGLIYLNGNNGVSGRELMSFDPSNAASSIRLVADINEGPGNGYPMNMIAVDGKLYFMINTFMGSDEPWFRGVDELWVFDPSCL